MSTKTASKSTVLGTQDLKETNNALTVVKKKMTVQEKLDSLMAFEALSSKHEYLTETKQTLESFGTGNDGFSGAKMILSCSYKEVKVSNPAIVEELTKIARMRLQEAIIKTEKEIEEFTIS